MEFQKDYGKAVKRLIEVYHKQQLRRCTSFYRKEGAPTLEAFDAVERTPVYAFKATIGGKSGFVVMSEREAQATGMAVEKAICSWVTNPIQKNHEECIKNEAK